MMRARILLFCAVVLLLAGAGASAAVFTVTNLNDSGAGSLRQAVEDANANAGFDVIEFQSGLRGDIFLASGGLDLQDGVDIAGPGADELTVSGASAYTVFTVEAAVSAGVSGLTIDDGVHGFVNNGSLGLSECHVFANSNTDDGAGIYNNGELTLFECEIAGNSPRRGSGVFDTNLATLAAVLCTFDHNFAPADTNSFGGAIFDGLGSTSTIDSCTFVENTAKTGGGYAAEGSNQVTNCTFSANSATTGGAIWVGLASLTLDHCTIFGDSATSGGGDSSPGRPDTE